MTTKRFWISISISALICLLLAGAIIKMIVWPAPSPSPAPTPVVPPLPGPLPEGIGIAQQKAKLQLGDGRTATFRFAVSAGTLSCAAAVGLDQVLCYDLVQVVDPAPPNPAPTPPGPQPPAPTPLPTPVAGNLRVLLLDDPLALIDMPTGQQAILTSPSVRAYLDQHCPLESGCASGRCPLISTIKTPSYRFLPTSADTSRLSPVWQQTCKAAAGKPAPWIIAVNEAGQSVIDQAWPASVEDTLALLRKFGGP